MDSDSQITTVSEAFYDSLEPQPEWISSKDLEINVEGAGGHKLPYNGCIAVKIGAPFMCDSEIEVLALVVPTTKYSLTVPVMQSGFVKPSATMIQKFQKSGKQPLFLYRRAK